MSFFSPPICELGVVEEWGRELGGWGIGLEGKKKNGGVDLKEGGGKEREEKKFEREREEEEGGLQARRRCERNAQPKLNPGGMKNQ